MSQKPKQIAIFGNYGVKNLGDELMLESLLNLCRQNKLESPIFCGNPYQVTAQHHIQAHQLFPAGVKSILRLFFVSWARSSLKKSYHTLKHCKAVIFGGGGLLVDIHFKAVVLWYIQLLICHLFKKKVYFIGNSIQLSFLSKFLFRPFLKRAELITVRDSHSQISLLEMGIKSTLLPDLTFMKHGEKHSSPNFAKDRIKLISLALCKWSIAAPQLKALKGFIHHLTKQGYKIVYLPFQTLNDDDTQLIKKIDPLGTIVHQSEILSSIKQSHALIGMRLHSIILAIQSHTPFIALSYQKKVSHFVNDLELSDYLLDVSKINKEVLQHQFQRLLKEHAKLTRHLTDKQKLLSRKAEQYSQIFTKIAK